MTLNLNKMEQTIASSLYWSYYLHFVLNDQSDNYREQAKQVDDMLNTVVNSFHGTYLVRREKKVLDWEEPPAKDVEVYGETPIILNK